MKLRLAAAAALVLASTFGAIGMIGPAEASGAAPAGSCTHQRSVYVDSGPSSAQVNLEACDDGYYLYGRVWDDACDGRAAHVQIEVYNANNWRTGNETRKAGNGCGTSTYFRFFARPYGDFGGARVSTWAAWCFCQDVDWL